jgi:hypothetical protein
VTRVRCLPPPRRVQVDEAAANASKSRPPVLASYNPHADGMGLLDAPEGLHEDSVELIRTMLRHEDSGRRHLPP